MLISSDLCHKKMLLESLTIPLTLVHITLHDCANLLFYDTLSFVFLTSVSFLGEKSMVQPWLTMVKPWLNHAFNHG